ncbi:MAG: sensor histidine kinase [Gaiellales bacterium]
MLHWRDRVTRADVALAAVVCVGMQVEVVAEDLSPQWVAASVLALQAALIAFRRAAPVLVLLVGLVGGLVMTIAGVSLHTPVSPIVFIVLAMYAVGLYEPLPRGIAGAAGGIALLVAAMTVARSHGEPYDLTDFPFIALLVATPWFVGRAMRARVQDSRELERRAERLERERLLAVAQERSRIARDLHDVVSHSVSVMVVQAGAAEEMLKRDPARAVEPIRSVQETGRQALVEMSRMVGLLRDDSHELGLAPHPGLDQLGALVDQIREAGLNVGMVVEGDVRPLPPGIELSAYRVVQEALTNVLKHAGDAHAQVVVRYAPKELELEVVDDGAGDGDGHSGGHGLDGMGERVNVFGGTLTAGPRPEGGFAVLVRLPLERPA